MRSLTHNGIWIPRYSSIGLSIKYKGQKILLSDNAECMAIAFARKFDTPYLQDKVFVQNFIIDFSKELLTTSEGFKELIQGEIKIEDFDFSEVKRHLETVKAKTEAMSKEGKKLAARLKKELRDKLKDKYGYATVDGKRIPLMNWIAEPPCIFVSKGQNPLRGRWKRGITEEEITLNMSESNNLENKKWADIVWKSDEMWIASWKSPLDGKMKYVWFSPATSIRQDKERKKFSLASKLASELDKLERYIDRELNSKDIERRRRLATVVYLIKTLAIRVGDEKISEEHGTVGCTTLKSENVTISDREIKLEFEGKDSVHWIRKIRPEDSNKILINEELVNECQVLQANGEQNIQNTQKNGIGTIEKNFEGKIEKDTGSYHKTRLGEQEKLLKSEKVMLSIGKKFSGNCERNKTIEQSNIENGLRRTKNMPILTKTAMTLTDESRSGNSSEINVTDAGKLISEPLNSTTKNQEKITKAPSGKRTGLNSDSYAEVVTTSFIGIYDTVLIPHKDFLVLRRNMLEFIQKAKGDFIFKGLNSNKVSEFLREVIPNLSAKVFRTLIAGITWDETAKENLKLIAEDSPVELRKYLFKMTNLAVAQKLNHKKALPRNWTGRLAKKEERYRKEHTALDELKEAKQEKIFKQERKTLKALLDLEAAKATAEWNLGTSLTSYIDPNKVMTFVKEAGLSIDDVYTKSLKEKYSWAIGGKEDEEKEK